MAEKHIILRLCGVAGGLLAVDTTCQGLTVADSNIPGAGDGVFAISTFQKGDVICWYGGTLMYDDLFKASSKHQERVPVRFGVTKEDFDCYALDIEVNESALDELAKLEITPALEWI